MRILIPLVALTFLGCFDPEIDCLSDPYPSCEDETRDTRCTCVGPGLQQVDPPEPPPYPEEYSE